MIPVSELRDVFFGYTVQFFHRTVRDYLQDNSKQSQIKSRLPGFDIPSAYCRLCLAELKFARTKESYLGLDRSRLYNLFEDAMSWLEEMATSGHELPFNFVEEFGKVLNSYRQLPFSHPEETVLRRS